MSAQAIGSRQIQVIAWITMGFEKGIEMHLERTRTLCGLE